MGYIFHKDTCTPLLITHLEGVAGLDEVLWDVEG